MEMMPCPITVAVIIAITLLCDINRGTFAAVLNEGVITTSSSASTISSSVEFTELPCNFTTLASQRSKWASEDDSCNRKVPFNLWVIMKAEGTANDPEAMAVEEQCIQAQEINLLELITPEDWDSSSLDAAPGKVLSETLHTATFAYGGPLDFEAICADLNIVAVNLVVSKLESRVAPPRRSRHLQTSTSEAVAAHKVTELIEGLQNLGCTRTNGEDTTLCVMSDSFNRLGQSSALEASGDLPPVDVVKELPEDDPTAPSDEGSAMIELAYDIASGANYKFNTASIGETAFADDIEVLGGAEGCDVIVDDIGYTFTPAFRDGPIATAVDTVADSGVLYFSAAGNDGYGVRFTGNMECSTFLTSEPTGTCDEGQGMLVWDEGATDGFERYFLEIIVGVLDFDTTLVLHWDDDDFAARALNFYVIQMNSFTGSLDEATFGFSPTGRATAAVELFGNPALTYFVAVVQFDSAVEPVEMHLQTFGGALLFASTADGGSILGQPCATKAFSVAAMNWDVATGEDGAYADPEIASVADYSSRGPCVVSTGGSLESRNHPVTTAATKLRTSSDERTTVALFATLALCLILLEHHVSTGHTVLPMPPRRVFRVRRYLRVRSSGCGDCYSDQGCVQPKDYDYTIDVTSDAGGAPETFGVDAGFGIMSADQMLAWVAANCQESCPGLSSPPTTAPPTTASPTTAPPTTAPSTTAPPTTAPPTTAPPAPAPPSTASPTTTPPTTAPPSTALPTTAPPSTAPPTTAPPTTAPPTTAPPTTAPPTTAPPATAPPTTVPPTTVPPTIAPPTTAPPTTAPPTTVPPTTAHPTTAPPTTTPLTTAPPTTAPPITVPPTAVPPVSLGTCSNGVPGVEGFGECCRLECGTCGGAGCSRRANRAGLDAGDCCVTRIRASGVFCEDSGTAPCIITRPGPPSPTPTPVEATCSDGVVGVEGFGECCTLGCGTCGGVGCGERARETGLEAEDCCVTRIRASGVYCEDSGTAPCIITRDPSPTPSPVSGLVEAGSRTVVSVKASAFDSRTSGAGCAPIGCVAANTRDSSLSSRWSCKGDLFGCESCEMTFNFEEPQDIVRMDIAFYKGTERTRLLEVEVNGSRNSEIESGGTTDDLENFELDADEVETVTLRSLGLSGNEWISLTEVQFMVL